MVSLLFIVERSAVDPRQSCRKPAIRQPSDFSGFYILPPPQFFGQWIAPSSLATAVSNSWGMRAQTPFLRRLASPAAPQTVVGKSNSSSTRRALSDSLAFHSQVPMVNGGPPRLDRSRWGLDETSSGPLIRFDFDRPAGQRNELVRCGEQQSTRAVDASAYAAQRFARSVNADLFSPKEIDSPIVFD